MAGTMLSVLQYPSGNQFKNTVEVSKLQNKQSKGQISPSSKLHLC